MVVRAYTLEAVLAKLKIARIIATQHFKEESRANNPNHSDRLASASPAEEHWPFESTLTMELVCDSVIGSSSATLLVGISQIASSPIRMPLSISDLPLVQATINISRHVSGPMTRENVPGRPDTLELQSARLPDVKPAAGRRHENRDVDLSRV